jgi:hypothetical protein
MLARAAAAEVVAGQQNLRALGARLVQDEAGLRISGFVIAPVAEELLVEAFLGSGFEEARGDDLVGVDVVGRQRNDAAFEWCEFCHWDP